MGETIVFQGISLYLCKRIKKMTSRITTTPKAQIIYY